MTVDATGFLDLPEEMRWEVLRTLDLTSIERMAETNTQFRDTVSAMIENRTDIAVREFQTEVEQHDATAKDLDARFKAIFGDEPWTRTVWQDAVMPQEVAIMENIERRLALRGYGDDPDADQLWSAIEDMELLRPERALEWLQKFEEPLSSERLQRVTDGEAQPDTGGIWPEIPSVTFREFASTVRQMYERRGEFFVDEDGITEIPDDEYDRVIASENQRPGFILRLWAREWIRLRRG